MEEAEKDPNKGPIPSCHNSPIPAMEEQETHLNAPASECHHSSNDWPLNVIIKRGAENPVTWGDVRKTIRYLLPDEILSPGEVNVAEAYAGPTNPELNCPAESSELSLAASGSESGTGEGAKGMTSEDQDMIEGGVVPKSGPCTGVEADENRDELVIPCGKAREIAAEALAAISEDETSQSTTPSNSAQREPPSDSLSTPNSSPSTSKSHRSPIWRSLVPVSPPPNGYWTPSTTTEGEKNTPMCPPCRTGKKGKCLGGLPCDRCREKGYSKERCEGSVVFRVSPRRKRGTAGAAERERLRRKSPTDSARWKRDAFGRFV